jgi:hypothetical protein
MKKITLLMSLLFTTIGFSQTLPFDFSTANHLMAGVGGATSTLEQEGTNDVLQIVGATQPYDHARADFASPLDLSDNANNTLTFEIKPVNGTGSGSHLVKFESGAGQPVTELFFTTTGTDWQTITLNFGSNLGSFASMILFIDFGDSNASFSDTYLVDDISVGADPAATCDDGIQNGDETGIDCGGPACDACPVVTLPLDFSDASQLFTHDGAGAGGSVVLENGKLRFNGNGQAYDQAYLDLTETFSTIDSDNNTFTVRMEPLLVPAGEERTHLLKVSIGTGAAIEITGKSIGSDEQDVTFNFGTTGAEPWNRITIFMDFGPDGANTYNAKVTDYLISSISLGADPAIPQVPPTVAAPTPPARNAADVISIYSKTTASASVYSDIAGVDFPNWGGNSGNVTPIAFEDDLALKLPEFTYQGIQFPETDLSGMTMLHLDIWAQSQGVGLDLIVTGGASNRVNIASNDGEWSSVDIPLTAFPGLDLSKIFQMKFYGLDGANADGSYDIYLDNIYLYTGTALSVDKNNVLNVNMYPNPAKGFVNFSSASNETLDVAVYDMLGKEVLRANAVQSQLNISSLNPGMYFVNMTQGSNVSTKKLLVN